jgi:hypothetical protein
MKKHFLLYILISLIAFSSTASDSTKVRKDRHPKSLRFFYQAGKVLQTNKFVQGQNAAGTPVDNFHAASFQYGIETDGRKIWQQVYGYPTWGFGFYEVNFFNKAELGTPSAIYSFINAPLIKRFKRWSINYEVGFGLTYNWEPYDPITNPYQYAVGSNKTVFIDAGLNADIQLGKHFDITAGFTFTHFSNGATRVPNYGINLVAPRVGLKYIFKNRPEFIKKEIPKYNKEWEYIVLFATSIKQLAYQVIENNGDTSYLAETYGIYTLSTGINRQISYKVKFGLGTDISYDNSYNSYIKYENAQTIERLNAGKGIKVAVGFYGSFELVINKVSMVVQPGWYVYREEWSLPESPIPPTETNPVGMAVPKRKPGPSYQRIGLKYHIFENVFAGINVRAYDFSIADYIEWNIGYRIKWQKSYRK